MTRWLPLIGAAVLGGCGLSSPPVPAPSGDTADSDEGVGGPGGGGRDTDVPLTVDTAAGPADTDDGGPSVDTDDTDDTDTLAPAPGPPRFNGAAMVPDWSGAIALNCAANQMTITVETTNWGYDAELYMADTRFTQDYDEVHTLDDINPALNGSRSVFSRTLSTNAAFSAVVPDVSSLFKCDAGAGSGSHFKVTQSGGNFMVTYALLVRDVNGSVADCVVFGHNPTLLRTGPIPPDLVPPAWVRASCRDLNP